MATRRSPHWTRRTLLASTTSALVLACSGTRHSRPRSSPKDAARLFLPAPEGIAPSRTTDPPSWLLDAPALFVPTAESAGSGVLQFADGGREALCTRITRFDDLPRLLDLAEALGTSVIHLVDWFEAAPGDRCEDAWRNKGDYVVRSDLGGAAALKRGIAAVHQRGGRVLLYLEPFLFNRTNPMGVARGQDWQIKDADGSPPPADPYDGYELCPRAPGMAEHFVAVARRAVAEVGADGLFLDSYGLQRGWRCHDPDHGHALGDPEAFTTGAVDLARRIRAAIQAERPDAVLLMEGPNAVRMFAHVDASQDWGVNTLATRALWDRPGRVFTTGWSLDDLHQILAMGQKLALTTYFLDAPTGSCADALAAEVARKGSGATDKSRRYAGERLFRVLHHYRNAGIVLGLEVPALDAVCPRRMESEGAFASEAAYQALVDQLGSRARAVDEALAGVGTLPSAGAHIQGLLRRRHALGRYFRPDARAELLANTATMAAYGLLSKAGLLLAVVNVGNGASTLAVPVGGRTEEVTVAAHGLKWVES